ncbi:hypothetical protein [Streptomyces acidicola]|uniref:hypothetical protein n=1 Tax=Streptomyces acidicola TaxID=2596892 RepID=UPI00382698AB
MDSHSLIRLTAIEAVRGSFDAAIAAVGRRCGPVIGKRQVELAVVAAASDIDTFCMSGQSFANRRAAQVCEPTLPSM